MNRILFSLLAAMALALTFGPAHAVDILSQDEAGHMLKLTMKDGTEMTVEIAAKGELRPICEDGGCRITLEDGQFVDAKSEDIVFIDGGKIEVYVP